MFYIFQLLKPPQLSPPTVRIPATRPPFHCPPPYTVAVWCGFRRYDPPGLWDLQNEITVPDNRTTFNVTGLVPFTAYTFRIFSVNSVGRSLASEPSYPMVTHREGEQQSNACAV